MTNERLTQPEIEKIADELYLELLEKWTSEIDLPGKIRLITTTRQAYDIYMFDARDAVNLMESKYKSELTDMNYLRPPVYH
ncbi:hypothetical protein CL617_01495 [archaeon]|nr:hypothetical protein [archaeon]|tara:strand:- start:3681 stop:3923 length:243 start_codon:yes stop_codon:yes gene_type:complete